jgi:hypothetical protein
LLAALFGSGRIYYGAFGRGLFQSLYPARGVEPVLQIPLSIVWLGAAAILIAAGALLSPLGFLGFAALAVSFVCAAVAAMAAPLDRAHSGPWARATLVALCILGPLVRSIERERVRWRFDPGAIASGPGRTLQMRGAIVLVADDGASIAAKPLLDDLRAAIVRRGLTVAPSDGFEPYDLQIRLPPAIRVPINALDEGARRVTLRWRLSLARGPLAISACVLAILLLIARFSLTAIGLIVAFAACVFVALAVSRATLIPAVLRACADQVCEPGVRLESSDVDNA